MRASATTLMAAAVFAMGLSLTPASAAGLLGGILDNGGAGVVSGVTDTVGDVVGGLTDSGSGGGGSSTAGLLSLKEGSAGNSSLVNVGLGSNAASPNNLADVKLGGNTGLLGGSSLSVTGGNGQGGLLNNGGLLGTGLLDGDDDGGLLGSGILGSNLTAGLNLGGLGLDLTVPGIDDLLGGGGAGGGTGGNGNSGGNGNNGNNGNNGANGRILVGSIDGQFQVSCSVNDGRQVLQLASQTKLNPQAWGRAANVQVIPIKLCPAARAQVAQIFNASGKIQQLQSYAAGDALIVASLGRTRYDVGDVFAVSASGGRLVVYVY